MSEKKGLPWKQVRRWPFDILIGILILAAVGVFSIFSDMKSTESKLADTANYIKNQCNGYNRLNLASEAKSLMRIMESVRQIDRQMSYEEPGKMVPSEESLKKYAQENYVTGVFILDADGQIQSQAQVDGLDLKEELLKYMEVDTLLETEHFPEKNYGVRIEREDGTYIDLAACGRSDASGILVAYYHTPLDYVNSFYLSFQSLLSGYNLEEEGTIIVADGTEILASNNETLIGGSIDDIAILRNIRQKGKGSKLVQAKSNEETLKHDFGLMEHGRDYYVYVYMPEGKVFSSVPKNMVYALFLCLLVIGVLHMARWNIAQRYREEQIRIQQQYAQSLQNKNRQLKDAVNQADRANAAKTSFLSRMSHDIRTPLNGIIGLLKIDEAHPDDLELISTNRGKIMIAANHLLSLINDILQMSKLESGEIALSHEVIDLSQLAVEIITIVEQRAAETGIFLGYDKNSEQVKYPYIYGSPLHMRQLFLNIYSNCIKYNKIGGKVTTTFKYIGAHDGTVTYQWIISDTGIGMSQEFLDHIFDPFSQERSDARSVYNGTGLGMAIVKGLVDEMNGTIQVTSKEGEGSTFIITLPFEIAEEVPESKEQNISGVDSIRGIHLLLAEDNDLNAEIAETLLGDEGAVITMVRDGQEAIDAFAGNPPGTFDAILMDVMMPKVDGLAATRTIREMEREDAKKIPIIAMTANAFDEDAQNCLRAGMNAHLSKPLQMDKVIATIVKFCAVSK
ncbi:ATP-binding protein [Blautia sp. MSJ-19]|uniref:ATP-binding protein n=1 Tax=Blautia sp. MSJ-19 TaxID=2841517 RepID=UPI001C0EFE33|nr:ATP-binding protein [Blautia sp. MSJ-19]MBU5479744.1 response regulator [Blautia sp. MSJ-19]